MTKINNLGDIVTVLRSVDEARWPEVREALAAGGSGHAFAPDLDFGNPPEIPEIAHDLFQEAVESLAENRAHQYLAATLHENISFALYRVKAARNIILKMKTIGDIEFIEGDGDVDEFLKDAARMLRAAQGLKCTDETGELK